MTRSRGALAVGVLAAATTILAGCGNAGVTPHTAACRTYELKGGIGSSALAPELISYLAGTSDNLDAITGEVQAIRAAAVEAGLTKNLSASDYERYKALVDKADVFVAKLTTDSPDPLGASASASLQKAIKATETSCA